MTSNNSFFAVSGAEGLNKGMPVAFTGQDKDDRGWYVVTTAQCFSGGAQTDAKLIARLLDEHFRKTLES